LVPIIRVKAESFSNNPSAGLITLAAVAIIGSVIIFSLDVSLAEAMVYKPSQN